MLQSAILSKFQPLHRTWKQQSKKNTNKCRTPIALQHKRSFYTGSVTTPQLEAQDLSFGLMARRFSHFPIYKRVISFVCYLNFFFYISTKKKPTVLHLHLYHCLVSSVIKLCNVLIPKIYALLLELSIKRFSPVFYFITKINYV